MSTTSDIGDLARIIDYIDKAYEDGRLVKPDLSSTAIYEIVRQVMYTINDI